MPLGTEVGLGPGDVVLDRVPAPHKRGTVPQFSVHVYCGQTVGWMKTPLGTEVDPGPGHIVLDRDPARPAKGAQHPLPLFVPCLLWPLPIAATDELLFLLIFAILYTLENTSSTGNLGT